jgi:hypothetical protein
MIGQKQLTERQRELLSVITVGEDGIARFPKEPRIPDWPALKKVMTALGGSWKTSDGFRFAVGVDADELICQARMTGHIIDPRAADFFETPDELADLVVAKCGPIPDGSSVLEPSAGRGALVRAIRRACKPTTIFAVEALDANIKALEKLPWTTDDGILHGDFMSLRHGGIGEYDFVVMYPPFSKRQDIAHVQRAYRCFLKPGGTLVAIMSGGVAFREDALASDFRAFVEANGEIEKLPDGAFKASGTMVRTALVTVRKWS